MKITREKKSMYTFNAYLNIQCLFKAEICSRQIPVLFNNCMYQL